MIINKDLVIEDTNNSLKNISDKVDNNVALLTPTVLYDGGVNGTNGNVTLSDNWENYSYIEVFYRRLEYETNSVRSSTDLVNGTSFVLEGMCCFQGYGNGFWWGWKQFKFTTGSKTVTTSIWGNAYVTASGQGVTTQTSSSSDNTIKIMKILGWK